MDSGKTNDKLRVRDCLLQDGLHELAPRDRKAMREQIDLVHDLVVEAERDDFPSRGSGLGRGALNHLH
jgi:aminoglycoside/choline kinase family phosphotransferase